MSAQDNAETQPRSVAEIMADRAADRIAIDSPSRKGSRGRVAQLMADRAARREGAT